MESSATTWNTVAIVGVGLIGGSLGLALRERGLAQRVVGIGRRQASLKIARRMGAVTESTLDLARGVAAADLVVVCTPVGRIVDDVRAAAAACPREALITDVGSTKAGIVAAVEGQLPKGVTFLGGHPMAGSEKKGPAVASADLFVDRAVILTPTRRTPVAVYERLAELWQAVGANVLKMSPAAHDRAAAAISHVPHVASAALATVTPANALPLAAGGWLDTTRVAGGDPSLWRQILVENRENVLTALLRYEKQLAAIRGCLERHDDARLERLLQQAKRKRDAVGS